MWQHGGSGRSRSQHTLPEARAPLRASKLMGLQCCVGQDRHMGTCEGKQRLQGHGWSSNARGTQVRCSLTRQLQGMAAGQQLLRPRPAASEHHA